VSTTKKTGDFMRKRLTMLRAAGTTLALGAGVWVTAGAQVNDLPGGPAVNQLNFHPAVTRIAEEQHWLHWFMMVICAVIFVLVFGVMFYSILKHRKSVGHKSQELAEPIWVELGWTIVPLLIVIGMALPATKVLVAQKDTTNSDLTIKATGMQWKWGYDYIKGEGEGIGFLSTLDNSHREMSNSGNPPPTDNYLLKVDNPMVVPVGKKVRIITTANDVIHAWMVPAFGVKQDAIPGFVRDTWFRAEKVGDYYGQCAELCGKEHAYMPIHVRVLTAEDYAAGRVYLPAEDLARFGCRPEDLGGSQYTPDFIELMKFEAARAREYYAGALALAAPGQKRRLLPALIMGALYRELLEKIERGGFRIKEGRVRLTRPQKLKALLRALLDYIRI